MTLRSEDLSTHARYHTHRHEYEPAPAAAAAAAAAGHGSIRRFRNEALLLRGPGSLSSSEFTPSRKSDYATRRQCVVLLMSHTGCRQARVWFAGPMQVP